jgi:hypothetical protein
MLWAIEMVSWVTMHVRTPEFLSSAGEATTTKPPIIAALPRELKALPGASFPGAVTILSS